MNIHIFLDHQGSPLAPAIVWQDGRCGAEAAALDMRIDGKHKIHRWGAPMPVDASHCLAWMQWMADHRPGVWDQTRHVMLPKN